MGGPWPMKATIHSRPSAVSLKVWLRETRWNLAQYIDLALWLCGSPLTVGEEEDHVENPNNFFRGANIGKLQWPWSLAYQCHHHVQSLWSPLLCFQHSRVQSLFTRWPPAQSLVPRLPPAQSHCTRWPSHHSLQPSWMPLTKAFHVTKAFQGRLRQVSSLADPPLMSVHAAGIPRASALVVTETVPLSSVLLVMAVTILCIWATRSSVPTPVLESAHVCSRAQSSPWIRSRACSSLCV